MAAKSRFVIAATSRRGRPSYVDTLTGAVQAPDAPCNLAALCVQRGKPQDAVLRRMEAGMLSTLALAATLAAGPVTVFVAVEKPEGRFVDPEAEAARKDAQDSADDLTKKLRGKDGIEVVDSAEAAMVIITVVGRGRIPTGATVTRAEWGGALKTDEETVRTVYAILSVDGYSLDLFGQNDGRLMGAWGTAAGKLANKIEEWIEANAEQLSP